MSTPQCPPGSILTVSPDRLKLKEEESLVRKPQSDTFGLLMPSSTGRRPAMASCIISRFVASLKEGIEEYDALLAPEEPESILVLSSVRSESVKGFVTSFGMRFAIS